MLAFNYTLHRANCQVHVVKRGEKPSLRVGQGLMKNRRQDLHLYKSKTLTRVIHVEQN